MDLEVIAIRDELRTLTDDINRRLDVKDELEAVRADMGEIMAVLGIYEDDDETAKTMAISIIGKMQKQCATVDVTIMSTVENTGHYITETT